MARTCEGPAPDEALWNGVTTRLVEENDEETQRHNQGGRSEDREAVGSDSPCRKRSPSREQQPEGMNKAAYGHPKRGTRLTTADRPAAQHL